MEDLNPELIMDGGAREFTFDFAAVVQLSGECFLYIQITKLNSTTSTEPRLVEATIVGPTPSPYPMDVKLNYSTDKGSNWTTSQMNYYGETIFIQVQYPDFPVNTQC